MRGSHLPHAKFSLQSMKFSLRYAMEIMFGMFLFAFWTFRTQKCEVVMFSKFKSACLHSRPLRYLDVPYLYRAHAPCMHTHVMHGRNDVMRFTYNVIHIIMMSLEFTFHSCHVGIRWHDVIGACISLTPCHHGSLCISMM